MSLRELLSAAPPAMAPGGLAPVTDTSGGVAATEAYKQLKGRIHVKLLEKFDLTVLETLPQQTLRQEISSMVERLLQEEQAVVNDIERRTLVRDIQHEMLGF